MLALLLLSLGVFASDGDHFNMVGLPRFMQGSLQYYVDIKVPVPKEYEALEDIEETDDNSFWMRPRDMSAALETGHPPSEFGYISGEISMSVGFDLETKTFIGFEEPQLLREAKKVWTNPVITRFDHPTMLPIMLVSYEQSSKLSSVAFLALGVGTNVVMIRFRPRSNSAAVRDDFNKAFISELHAKGYKGRQLVF
jgi:hypothetical protein